MRYDPFFLLDSPIICILRLKKCFTTVRVVMSETYTCLERSPECLFKDDTRPGEIVSRQYMSYLVRDICMGLTCR